MIRDCISSLASFWLCFVFFNHHANHSLSWTLYDTPWPLRYQNIEVKNYIELSFLSGFFRIFFFIVITRIIHSPYVYISLPWPLHYQERQRDHSTNLAFPGVVCSVGQPSRPFNMSWRRCGWGFNAHHDHHHQHHDHRHHDHRLAESSPPPPSAQHATRSENVSEHDRKTNEDRRNTKGIRFSKGGVTGGCCCVESHCHIIKGFQGCTRIFGKGFVEVMLVFLWLVLWAWG